MYARALPFCQIENTHLLSFYNIAPIRRTPRLWEGPPFSSLILFPSSVTAARLSGGVWGGGTY